MTCVAPSQIVCVIGTSIGSLSILMLGRAIFGLGGESINVAQNAILTEWFAGQVTSIHSVVLSNPRPLTSASPEVHVCLHFHCPPKGQILLLLHSGRRWR